MFFTIRSRSRPSLENWERFRKQLPVLVFFVSDLEQEFFRYFADPSNGKLLDIWKHHPD